MAESAKPSPQELSSLEQAFAQDPAAYRPLAEGYLALGRFMEAMLVAKKGAKAKPTEAAPRVVLARIYAEQNKDPKAMEELNAGLALQPGDLDALKLLAQLFFKTGQRPQGGETLLKALKAAPGDPEVTALMSKFGVQPPAPPAPPPPPPSAAPMLRPQGFPRQTQQLQAMQPRTVPPIPGQPGQPMASPQSRIAVPLDANGQPMPRARTMQMQAQVAYDLARLAEEEEAKAAHKKHGPGLTLTIALAVVAMVGLAILFGYSKYRNKRDHEISSLLKGTQEQLAHDSYASYQQAEKSAQRALELDPTNFAADAYLAYINALRFGENGEGEDFLKRAEEYLTAAKAQNQPHAYIYAADAYIKFFSRKPEAAEAELSEILTKKDATGHAQYQSNLLSGALGMIQLSEGKLKEARANLVDAHQYAPADVRVTAALGTVDARLGSIATAETFFQAALKVDSDHVPALLGLAQLELDNEPPDVAGAEKTLSHLSALGAGALSPRQAAYAKFMHAQLLYANKSPQAADEEKGAFALDPSNPEMLVGAGRRLRRAGQNEKAVALFRQAIELDPNRGAFYAELGEAYLGMPTGAGGAAQQLAQAVAKLPNNARLHTLLAEAYYKEKQFDKALGEWQATLEIDPDSSDAHLGLARLYTQKGDATHSHTEYEQVAHHAQGATLAEADTELGRVAMDKGDASKAKELFTSALGADANFAPPYFYVGKLLLADRGQRPQAKALFQSYLKLAPEGPFAAEARKLMH